MKFGRLRAVGVFVLLAVVLNAYYPVLTSGFHLDDWYHVETAGRLGFLEYVLRSFDLRQPSFLNAYRPMQGLFLAIEYAFFGGNPLWYHVVHVLLHFVNGLMLAVIVWRVSGRFRLSFLAGMLYATLPVFGVSVFLPSAPDVWATLFYLLAIWFWLSYLETQRRRDLVSTLGTFVLV